ARPAATNSPRPAPAAAAPGPSPNPPCRPRGASPRRRSTRTPPRRAAPPPTPRPRLAPRTEPLQLPPRASGLPCRQGGRSPSQRGAAGPSVRITGPVNVGGRVVLLAAAGWPAGRPNSPAGRLSELLASAGGDREGRNRPLLDNRYWESTSQHIPKR